MSLLMLQERLGGILVGDVGSSRELNPSYATTAIPRSRINYRKQLEVMSLLMLRERVGGILVGDVSSSLELNPGCVTTAIPSSRTIDPRW